MKTSGKRYVSFLLLLTPMLSFGAEEEYTDGVFIVNEDWYGHQNSTVNWLSSEGEWTYRVFQLANQENGNQLGCTNQYGQIYGDRFYFIAKQDKDPGASVQGGRITVADARTMKMLYQSPIIDPAGNQCDGRGYLGVDEHKGYISTSNGIWIFDTDSYTVKGQVEGSANPNGSDGRPNTDPTGSLYHGQCGTMVRVNDRVFAAHQQYGLLVIDPATDKVTGTVTMQAVKDYLPDTDDGKEKVMPGIGSVVLAKDGSLWVSVARDVQGTGATLPYLMRVDPSTLETDIIEIPAGIYPPSNSWYAWTPDGFCASFRENVLYWNGGPNSWFSNARIYKYDIDKDEVSVIINLDKEAQDEGLDKYSRWNIYGCSMRPHPVTDELYISLFHYFQNPNYTLRRADSSGNTLQEYPMISNYWFPSLPVFPDLEMPVAHDPGRITVSTEESTIINLSGLFTDADSMEAAIVKSILSVSDPDEFAARIINGNLEIEPLNVNEGSEGYVEVKGNSNGKIATVRLELLFSTAGITETTGVNHTSAQYYNLQGEKVNHPERGIYIRVCGGKTEKIIL
ncbi:MAG: DUF5074 domain-containing protein [Muribaculaceae bacterium]|nr:DUF5074 domain-containing protein [Muribaculaceae bacterium]